MTTDHDIERAREWYHGMNVSDPEYCCKASTERLLTDYAAHEVARVTAEAAAALLSITDQDIEWAREWLVEHGPFPKADTAGALIMKEVAPSYATYAAHVTAEKDAEIERLRIALEDLAGTADGEGALADKTKPDYEIICDMSDYAAKAIRALPAEPPQKGDAQ